MEHATFLSPKVAPAQPAVLHDQPPRMAGGGMFWNPGIGLGVSVILALGPDIDSLSQRIGQLPAPPGTSRPRVGQYLFMVKTLAAAWVTRSRPGLESALNGLRHFGEGLAAQDAPPLDTALLNMANGRPSSGPGAARLIDGLVRRLAAPAEALEAVDTDFGSYLAQMASASADLETDTVRVTQRMQADHVHAFILAQQVNTLQGKLAEARARCHSHWLPGPEAEAARKDSAAHGGALDGVMRQLEHIRADQAAMMTEAAYLQGLLPTLSAYLGGVDRMGAGIHAALVGTRALRADLDQLKNALLAGPANSAEAHAQLHASLPAWRALAAGVAAFPAN